METATPAESARTEDPGLSKAREAAEVVPAETVHRNEKRQPKIVQQTQSLRIFTFLLTECSFSFKLKISIDITKTIY